ncbi:unnamed protein product [Discosporangium mesarthrocarpum]
MSVGRLPPFPTLGAVREIFERMDARTVARCVHVHSTWQEESSTRDAEGYPVHPGYAGIHGMVLHSALNAHDDMTDSLFYIQPPKGSIGRLFTAGQKCVRAWKYIGPLVSLDGLQSLTLTVAENHNAFCYTASETAERDEGKPTPEMLQLWKEEGVAVRDTAPFTIIQPVNDSMVCCSSNGSLREWSLAHKIENMRFNAQFLEHNTWITGVVFSVPSLGMCRTHGIPKHACFMYSVSDDRLLKVWDMATKTCVHTVKPRVLDCGTLQSVARSDFHLYVGSSNGRIFVFALGRVCQRKEKHLCDLHDQPLWFCEQEKFHHGDEPIQHMVCGGVEGTFKYVFTGSRNGTIKVWRIPPKSFGHLLVCTFRQHKRAITALRITKSHLFSASDEGHVRVWSLGTLTLQRVIMTKWRIKSMWVHHAPRESDQRGTGSLFLGLATGRVLVYPVTDSV